MLWTFVIVAVVLLFISFLMYRCEKLFHSTDAKVRIRYSSACFFTAEGTKLTMLLKGHCHEMDILIRTFCVCADAFCYPVK